MNKAFSKASSELKSVMGKAKKVVNTVSDEAREISRAARQATRKQLAKFRGSKRTVKAIDIDKYITKKVAPKKASNVVPEVPSSTLKPMTEAELEGVAGGAIDPEWRPNESSIGKFADELTEYKPYTPEMRKHIIPPKDGYQACLERKYIKIRQAGLDDVKVVAKNTGLAEQDLIKLKKHLFLDTHNLSYEGRPLENLYFQANPEIAYSWERAVEGNLSVKEMEWFEQLLKHELTESEYMQQGMALRDPSTYDGANGYIENPNLNAHDKANLTARQPGKYPGYDWFKEYLKYEGTKIDY